MIFSATTCCGSYFGRGGGERMCTKTRRGIHAGLTPECSNVNGVRRPCTVLGLLKMPEVALSSRRPSPTIHPVLYVSCNCLACSSLGAFQPRAGLAKRWALASAGRWACALLQRASADADTSFSFFFGSVVEYCAAQQKLKAWLW